MPDDAQAYTDEELAALWHNVEMGVANQSTIVGPLVALRRLKATLAARDRRISELEAAIQKAIDIRERELIGTTKK